MGCKPLIEGDKVVGYVCSPTVDLVEKKRCKCPTCEKRRTMVSFHQEWYGWDTTCLSCGDRWQDGEMMPRPFAPGWRKRSIEAARRRYRQVTGARG